MFLKLNWIGLHVADFETSLRFYTDVLGIRASDTKSDWAYMETTGMVFELFGDSEQPASDQSTWGHGQPVRPSIQVANLHETVAGLRQRGVQFTTDVEQTSFGEMVEFAAPENRRWTLVHTPSYPLDMNSNKIHIGWLELKVERLTEQQWFYSEVLGLQPENGKDGQVLLQQGPGEPILLLEPGGQRAAPFQIVQNALQPPPSHLMSVATDNIEEAAAWIKSHNVPVLTKMTRKDWGGIDFYITDMDSNPIQIVQYIKQ